MISGINSRTELPVRGLGSSRIAKNDTNSFFAETAVDPEKKEESSGTYMKCTARTSSGHIGEIYYGKDIIASVGGIGGTVNVKYHESTTEEDPVVIAWGTDASGKEYEEVIHLNDINLNHASPAEIIALNAHLAKTGDESVGQSAMGALWNSLGNGNSANSKMDFHRYYKDYIAMQQLAHNNSAANLYQYELDRYLFFTQHSEAGK